MTTLDGYPIGKQGKALRLFFRRLPLSLCFLALSGSHSGPFVARVGVLFGRRVFSLYLFLAFVRLGMASTIGEISYCSLSGLGIA